MGKNPAFYFYPNDYLRDTQAATPSVRGIWMDLLCAMWWSQTRGVLTGSEEEMCRYGRCGIAEWRQFVELNSRQNFADVTFCGGSVTVANRRMVREERTRKLATCRKSRERERKCHANVTRASPSTPSTPSSIKAKNTVGSHNAPTLFMMLWAEYPKPKGAKLDALKAYHETNPPDTALEALLAQLAYKIECEKRGEFWPNLPHLHRWLRKRRWEDELPLPARLGGNGKHAADAKTIWKTPEAYRVALAAGRVPPSQRIPEWAPTSQ